MTQGQLTSRTDELSRFYSSQGGGEVIVLYDFHTTNVQEMNFKAIQGMINSGYEVIIVPQGRRDWLDYMSIGLGAKIEKRLTIGRTIPANGHWKAHEPSEFKDWINNLRECVKALVF